ncbi:hypothetical protein B0H10DRAFT_2008483 [Mycena sp. CBHHK59/15]|nr:hypothetical protein B0H10DRAFT_2008483 [Mycena sp. CBHHK59/15]
MLSGLLLSSKHGCRRYTSLAFICIVCIPPIPALFPPASHFTCLEAPHSPGSAPPFSPCRHMSPFPPPCAVHARYLI